MEGTVCDVEDAANDSRVGHMLCRDAVSGEGSVRQVMNLYDGGDGRT